jgi:nitrilase
MLKSDELTVAVVQMVSSDVIHENLSAIENEISEASLKGAEMVVLPENFALMASHSEQLLSMAEALGAGPIQHFLSDLAIKYNCWIVAGSLPTQSNTETKVYATCLVYDNTGAQVAHYHKIHLFDADVADEKGCYRESDTFIAGEDVITVDTPFGLMGLSICYDLRFPELYRELIQKGAQFIVAPSAFTAITGRAHWSLLCRARAVENSCYILAPNQGGRHANGRETHGHSMIVDPWGEVVSELAAGEGHIVVTLKKSKIDDVRRSLPAIKHRRI